MMEAGFELTDGAAALDELGEHGLSLLFQALDEIVLPAVGDLQVTVLLLQLCQFIDGDGVRLPC